MWGAAAKRGYKTGNRNRKLVTIVPFEREITHANFLEIGQRLSKLW